VPIDPSNSVQNIQATLMWNGVTQPTVTYNALSPGSTYWLPIQEANVLSTGYYTYLLDITVNKSGGGIVTQTSVSGSMYVVANDNTNDPYGDGWSIGGIDQLVAPSGAGGVVWVSGKRQGSRFVAG